VIEEFPTRVTVGWLVDVDVEVFVFVFVVVVNTGAESASVSNKKGSKGGSQSSPMELLPPLEVPEEVVVKRMLSSVVSEDVVMERPPEAPEDVVVERLLSSIVSEVVVLVEVELELLPIGENVVADPKGLEELFFLLTLAVVV
jgi:hypothetical protein